MNIFAEEYRLKAKFALERAGANLEDEQFVRANAWVLVAEQWRLLAESEEAAEQ